MKTVGLSFPFLSLNSITARTSRRDLSSLSRSLSLSLAIAALATAPTSPSLYTALSFLLDLLVGRSQCTAAGRSQWG